MSRLLYVAGRFYRALASMSAHYEALMREHPDAGSALDDLIDALGSRIEPLLVSQPGIGRRYRPAESLLPALLDEFTRVEVGPARGRVEFRRWAHGPFELLYAVTDDLVVLVSARDQRQQDFH